MQNIADTRTARIERTADGIVIVRIKPGAEQKIADARENIHASADACLGGKAPLLTDIRVSARLDAETRHYYSGRQLTDFFTALALLVPIGAFGRMFGNVYLRVAKPGIPTKLFDNEDDALAWLKGYLR